MGVVNLYAMILDILKNYLYITIVIKSITRIVICNDLQIYQKFLLYYTLKSLEFNRVLTN